MLDPLRGAEMSHGTRTPHPGRGNIGVTQRLLVCIVAISNPSEPVGLIKEKAADSADEVQDLGRVSAALLEALTLLPGEFILADGQRRAPSTETIL